jgi:dTDP-4-amino-4,6-dideoxygalactose transaminase
MIPYGRQNVTKADIEVVVKVLRSDFLTQGPTVPFIEKKLCNSKSSIIHKALKHADKYYSQALTLLLFPSMSLQQVEYITHEIFRFYKNGYY